EPDPWYFLTLRKTDSVVKAYVNEFTRFSGGGSSTATQISEIVIGASTYRGAGMYGEYFRGSIAQVIVWRRALLDPEVQETYHESENLFVTPPPLGAKEIALRADSATGAAPYPANTITSPWHGLVLGHDF